MLLLLGRNDRDPLVLQLKESPPSVLEPFVGPSQYAHQGQRVVAGQRLMQAAGDIFLGWQRIKGLDGVTRDYYVRQLHDWKGSIEVDELLVSGATMYARTCGATLARAHARWGDRIAIASYLGRSERSSARSPRSRRPTRTRTSVTTRRSCAPSTAAASTRSWVCREPRRSRRR